MKKTMLRGYLDQAEAMVDAHVASVRHVKAGEYPDINIGECAGKAIDFLRNSGVPVSGFSVETEVILRLEIPGREPVIYRIPIRGPYPIAAIRELLRRSVDDFIMNHGKTPVQEIAHTVTFLYDEAQIED